MAINKSSNNETMKLDEAMSKLGRFGKWQTMIVLSLAFTLQPNYSWNLFSILFIGYTPPHHCKIPTNASINRYLPRYSDGKFSSCSMFVNASTNLTTSCTAGWEYDITGSGATIVSEWDLVCEKAFWTDISQTTFFLCFSLGSALSAIADLIGRKPSLILLIICNAMLGTGSVFTSDYWGFTVVRCLNGFCVGALSIMHMVYLAESCSKRNETIFTMFLFFTYGINLCIEVLLAYIIHDWKIFTVFINLYSVLYLPFLICWLPETVYWLHANNKIEKAEKILVTAGKYNRVHFDKPIFQTTKTASEVQNFFKNNSLEKADSIFNKIFKKINFLKKKNPDSELSFKVLFTNKYLLRHMTFSISDGLISISYYGLSYIGGSISDNRYLSTFLNLSVMIPASILSWIFITKFEKRNAVILCSYVTSVFILLCLFVEIFADDKHKDYGFIPLTTISKFFSTSAWMMMFSYPPSLYPISIRSEAFGINLAISRTITTASSSSFYMFSKHRVVFIITLILCGFIGGTLVFLLPETYGKALPETLEDIEALHTKKTNSKASENYTKIEEDK